eukprot:7725703-Heterocapsa_arctica.AAC.1
MDVVLPAPRSDVFYRNPLSKNKMAPHDRPAAVVGGPCLGDFIGGRAALVATRRIRHALSLQIIQRALAY